MARADFRRLNQEAIQQAVQQTPDDWGLNMDLDLNVFERLEVYDRGEVVGEPYAAVVAAAVAAAKNSRCRPTNVWR